MGLPIMMNPHSALFRTTTVPIYVLMISELINGTLVNLDACDAAGVDPYAIHTWDDFTEACAKIKMQADLHRST